MANRVITLYIQDTEISLMVSRGKKISNWARLALEPGLVSEGVILDQAALADQIKMLFASAKVPVQKTIVGLSGINTIYRTISIPRLPEALMDDAVVNAVRRILPISLEQVHLSYQVLTSSGEETKLFVAAIPRRTIDTVLQVLRDIGATPYMMDLAPLALCRVLAETSAIIIDSRVSYLSISVVINGLPQVIRTQLIPSELGSSEERMSNMFEELDRTFTFYNSEHPELPMDSSTPIFVCGEPAHSPETQQLLADRLGARVMPLPLPLTAPEGFIPDDYMVNIGLALKEVSPGTVEAGLTPIDLNIIPRTYRPAPPKIHRIVIPVALGLAVILVAALVLRLYTAIDRNESLTSQMNTLETRVSEQQTELAKLQESVNIQAPLIEPIRAKTDMVHTLADGWERSRIQIDEDLVVIAGLMYNVEVHGINHTVDSVQLHGSAENRRQIFEYARALRDSGRFALVHISSIKQNLAEVEAMQSALDRVQQAMDALMEEAEIDSVDIQDTWTNEVTDLPTYDGEEVTILVEDDDDPETDEIEVEITLENYLGTPTTDYYYQWEEDGQVTQREEKVITLDFNMTLRIR
ncbi:pilus assembly protein PilM [Chloroflexota bacterium]